MAPPSTECAGASSAEVAAVAIRGEAEGCTHGNGRAVSLLAWLRKQVEVVCHVYVAYVLARMTTYVTRVVHMSWAIDIFVTNMWHTSGKS